MNAGIGSSRCGKHAGFAVRTFIALSSSHERYTLPSEAASRLKRFRHIEGKRYTLVCSALCSILQEVVYLFIQYARLVQNLTGSGL
jgi:hypothetical protein